MFDLRCRTCLLVIQVCDVGAMRQQILCEEDLLTDSLNISHTGTVHSEHIVVAMYVHHLRLGVMRRCKAYGKHATTDS